MKPLSLGKLPPQIFEELLTPKEGLEVRLSESSAHHLLTVMRLRAGDEVILSCLPHGEQFLAQIVAVKPTPSVLLERRLARAPEEPFPVERVILGLVKGERQAWACEKLSELGLPHLVLVATERSVVSINEGRERNVVHRLDRVARAAAMQSRRSLPMRVTLARSLREALDE